MDEMKAIAEEVRNLENSLEDKSKLLKHIEKVFVLTLDEAKRKPLVSVGALDALVQILRKYPETEDIQSSAWRVFSLLCICCEDSKKKRLALSVVDMLLASLIRYAQEMDLQTYGLTTFCALLVTETEDNLEIVRVIMSRPTLVKYCIKLMGRDTNNGSLQMMGCQALASLAHDSGEFTLKLVEMGAVKAIVTAMKAHRRGLFSYVIQEAGCTGLESFIASDRDTREIAVALNEQGALKCLKDTISFVPSERDIHIKIVYTVTAAADFGLDLKRAVLDLGFLDIGIQLFKKEVIHIESLSAALGLFGVLAEKSDEYIKQELMRRNIPQMVLQSSPRYIQEGGLTVFACRILNGMSAESPVSQKALVETGALDFIISTMKRYPSNWQVQLVLVETLSNLSELPETEVKARILKSGAGQLIFRAIYLHGRNENVFLGGGRALWNLIGTKNQSESSPDKLKRYRYNEHVNEFLFQPLRNLQDDSEAHIRAFQLLSQSEPVKLQLSLEDAQSVTSGMTRHCGRADVQISACTAIRNCCASASCNVKVFLGANALDCVFRAMKEHSDIEPVQLIGCATALSLCTSKSASSNQDFHKNWAEAILMAKHRFEENLVLKNQATQLLKIFGLKEDQKKSEECEEEHLPCKEKMVAETEGEVPPSAVRTTETLSKESHSCLEGLKNDLSGKFQPEILKTLIALKEAATSSPDRFWDLGLPEAILQCLGVHGTSIPIYVAGSEVLATLFDENENPNLSATSYISGYRTLLRAVSRREVLFDKSILNVGFSALVGMVEHGLQTEEGRSLLPSSIKADLLCCATTITLLPSSTSDVQKSACKLIWKLVKGDKEAREMVMDIRILNKANDSGSVLSQKTYLLVPVYKSLLDLMKRCQSCIESQEYLCGILTSLAVDSDAKVKLADADAFELILGSMQAHQNEVKIQQKACGALWNLASNKESAAKMMKGDTVEFVLHIMQHHHADTDVQHRACGFLWNLAMLGDESKMSLVRKGTASRILDAMESHRSNVRVQTQACGALAKLAMARETQKDLIGNDSRAFNCLLGAMKQHSFYPDLQVNCCKAIASLSKWDKENTLSLNRLGATNTIEEIMSAHVTKVKLQQSGSKALSNLRPAA